MKKNLLFLFAMLCLLGIFTGCKDDEAPETPPTVEDVIAEYSAENLKPTIEGVDVDAANVKIELAQSTASDKVTIILHNIVPGVPEFEVPDAEFATTTRSAYISTLKGEVTDNVSGYNVKVDGTIDDKVLTVKVVLTAIEAENTNTESLYNLVYKGKMDISVANIPTPISMEQRVYIAKARKIGTTKRDTSMVKLTIKDFAFQSLKLGDIALDTVLVQKRGEVFIFKAVDRKIELSTIGEVIANMQGTIVDNNMKLTLDIDASGLQVNVTFDGPAVVENRVAQVESMTFDSKAIVEQKKTISNLTLKVWEDVSADQLLLTPKYVLSEKAKVDSITLFRKGQGSVRLTDDQVAGKQPIDFSLLSTKNDYVKYWLTAEDPNVQGSFIIYVERIPIIQTNFTFETWADAGAYMEPTGWATSNSAATLLKIMTDDEGNTFYPADTPDPISKDGNNAKIITVDTKGYGSLIPAITAGTLFLGKFSADLTNTLKSTQFGIAYNREPLSFKGTYKFTAGPIYYRVTNIDKVTNKVTKEAVSGVSDKCSLTAVLYEVTSYDETLDGTNINTSEKIVASAVVTAGTTSGFVDFDIPMTYVSGKTFDASKKYKLAVVCSSSEKGDKFEGAPGSELIIQSLEVVNK